MISIVNARWAIHVGSSHCSCKYGKHKYLWKFSNDSDCSDSFVFNCITDLDLLLKRSNYSNRVRQRRSRNLSEFFMPWPSMHQRMKMNINWILAPNNFWTNAWSMPIRIKNAIHGASALPANRWPFRLAALWVVSVCWILCGLIMTLAIGKSA